MRKGAKKRPETAAALDRIAAALEGLPASRRSAIEKQLLVLDAERGGKANL
jgi:hypothetical protein